MKKSTQNGTKRPKSKVPRKSGKNIQDESSMEPEQKTPVIKSPRIGPGDLVTKPKVYKTETVVKTKVFYHNQDSPDKMSPRKYPKEEKSPLNLKNQAKALK